MQPLFAAFLAAAIAAPAPRHPRIWITAADLPKLRAMATDSRTNVFGWVPADECKKILERARKLAAKGPYHYEVEIPGRNGGPTTHWEYTLSDQPPPRHDTTRYYPPWTAMFQERADSITTRIKYFIFAYLLTGDRTYFDKAKEIVFHLCHWPIVWTDPSYGSGRPCLDTGHAAHAVALFYDWCYSALTPAERKLVRAALIEKAVVPIDKILDKIPDYHNYSAVITMGLGTGALALLGEDPRAETWLGRCLAKIRRSFDAQGRDGGPFEGPMYGTYFADSYARLLWGLHTAGVKTDIWRHRFLKTLPRYCIAMMAPGVHALPTFGDGGPTRAFPLTMGLLALRGDTDAAWYLGKMGALQPRSIETLLLLDPAKIRAREPRWNPSACFVDVGYASLRDGLREDAAYMAFKCGPPEKIVGHNHFDHNSFQICFSGQWLATDPGYRSYFNPPARKYTTSSFGHNTIALNLTDQWLRSAKYATVGVDQVRLNHGRIVRFVTTGPYDYIRGDATETYNTDRQRVMKKAWRDVLFIKPRIFVVRDYLEAARPSTFHFLLHTCTGREMAAQRRRLTITAAGAALDAEAFSPAGMTPWRIAAYPGAEAYGPYAAIGTPRVRSTTITCVLVPRAYVGVVNGGFEDGMVGWTPRRAKGYTEDHVIDDHVAHSGKRSGRIDAPGGYYYSVRIPVRPGQRLHATFWARLEGTKGGATPCFYFWRAGKSIGRADGPRPTGERWRRYSFSAKVPRGAEQACLALNFFSKTGHAWFDDVTVTVSSPPSAARRASVEAIDGGSSAVIVRLATTHIVLFSSPSATTATARTLAGHAIRFEGEMGCVSIGPEGRPRSFFLLNATRLELDGHALARFDTPTTAVGTSARATWNIRTIRRIEPALPAAKK